MVVCAGTHDEGFSLTELIVVLMLLGIILAISYGGLQAVQAARAVSDRQAQFASEVSTPLNAFEEVISQALKVEQAGPYSITVLTDSNNDNLRERHQIQCTTAGLVTHKRWATNSSQVNTTLEFDAVWSEHNSNQADASAMFVYYYHDDDGNAHATTVADDAEYVVVTLHILYDGRDYQDSRTIMMRNR